MQVVYYTNGPTNIVSAHESSWSIRVIQKRKICWKPSVMIGSAKKPLKKSSNIYPHCLRKGQGPVFSNIHLAIETSAHEVPSKEP
ncbi:hypothetical protein AB6A40_011526 [Gnathostoma spinigerum]|uniref:Uncharacterized protein n=1 Tax=Gnathostoma spinigerum TaxID=75299 RepID=A0ABD6F4G7_9BILA